MDASFSKNFNKIFVIESLELTDRKTGAELYDDIIYKLGKYGDGTFTTEFVDLENYLQYEELMTRIAVECGRGVNPILHFEIHGSELGLVLKNGDLVPFPILAMHLSVINRGCKNNLFLTLAICHGAMIGFSVKLNLPAPFLGFIGSYDEIYDLDILLRYTEFYQEFLINRDFERAFEIFVKCNIIEENKFHLIDTYDLFVKVYKDYSKKNQLPSQLKERAKMALKEEKFVNRHDKRKKEREFIKAVKRSRQKFYLEHSKTFFMLDLYPENIKRFPLPDNYSKM